MSAALVYRASFWDRLRVLFLQPGGRGPHSLSPPPPVPIPPGRSDHERQREIARLAREMQAKAIRIQDLIAEASSDVWPE